MKWQLTILVIPLTLVLGAVAAADLVPSDPRVQSFQVSGATPGTQPNDYTPDIPFGGVAYGIDTTGVGKIGNNAFPTNCTGTLLSGSRNILTAAHCVTDANGNITWGTAGGSDRITFTNAAGTDFTYAIRHEPGVTGGGLISVHPDFDGNFQHGYDVAVIRLPFPSPEIPPVDASITPYQIVSAGFSELDVTHVRVGYGYDGVGATGTGNPANSTNLGTKHAGLNNWDLVPGFADGTGGFPAVGNPATKVGNLTQLMYDFDNGLSAQDALNPTITNDSANGNAGGDKGTAGISDLGFGIDEVMSTAGDSGAPVFVSDGGITKIAGITSWGFTFDIANVFTWDIDGIPTIRNQSFGEVGVDARLSESSMNAFVLSALQDTAVPEPSSFLCLALIGVVGGGWSRLRTYVSLGSSTCEV